jgi:cobalamin biosynthesis protein CbiM
MLNFPVAAGTSGHLLGGALAAILVGPYVATLSLTVVLLMQALLFADGGLSAAGLNIFNMSLLGVWFGYGAFLLAKKILPKNKVSITAAAAFAGLWSSLDNPSLATLKVSAQTSMKALTPLPNTFLG